MSKLCLTPKEVIQRLNKRGVGYALHIKELEIFAKPKELGEFHYFKKRLIDCGRDCKSYFDEVKTQVRKAPQSWQYVYTKEKE